MKPSFLKLLVLACLSCSQVDGDKEMFLIQGENKADFKLIKPSHELDSIVKTDGRSIYHLCIFARNAFNELDTLRITSNHSFFEKDQPQPKLSGFRDFNLNDSLSWSTKRKGSWFEIVGFNEQSRVYIRLDMNSKISLAN